MTIDPDGLEETCKAAAAGSQDALASLLLVTTGSTFTEHTGGDEVAFIDCAMRLFTGALFKLDAEAAREYLAALADRQQTGMTVAVALAEIRRRACLNRLAQAFALAAGDTKGSC